MSMHYDSFLLFGDSITEFCYNSQMEDVEGEQFTLGGALTNVYTRKMNIIQRGFSGYTSRWGAKILPKILEEDSTIKLAYIFFGANDSCSGGLQHVPLDEYIKNTKNMVDMLKDKSIKTIIIGPALHDFDYWKTLHPIEAVTGDVRSNEGFKRYSDAAEQLAKEENIPFVDLHSAFKREGGDAWKGLLRDGLHFNGKGYSIMFNELLSAIDKHYPEYSPENMVYKLPNWRDVDHLGSELDKYL